MKSLPLLKALVRLTVLCLLLVLTVSAMLILDSFDEKIEEAPKSFCATVSRESTVPNALKIPFAEGKILFKNNCATCHSKNMDDNLTGPTLRGVADRWGDFPKADLYRWIRHSKSMVDEKHPRALELWKDWNGTVMTAFPNLSDEEIDAILVYIENK